MVSQEVEVDDFLVYFIFDDLPDSVLEKLLVVDMDEETQLVTVIPLEQLPLLPVTQFLPLIQEVKLVFLLVLEELQDLLEVVPVSNQNHLGVLELLVLLFLIRLQEIERVAYLGDAVLREAFLQSGVFELQFVLFALNFLQQKLLLGDIEHIVVVEFVQLTLLQMDRSLGQSLNDSWLLQQVVVGDVYLLGAQVWAWIAVGRYLFSSSLLAVGVPVNGSFVQVFFITHLFEEHLLLQKRRLLQVVAEVGVQLPSLLAVEYLVVEFVLRGALEYFRSEVLTPVLVALFFGVSFTLELGKERLDELVFHQLPKALLNQKGLELGSVDGSEDRLLGP